MRVRKDRFGIICPTFLSAREDKETNMGYGMRADLQQRLTEAHDLGRCLVPNSQSDARRLRKAYQRGDLVSPACGVYAEPELWSQLKPLARERQKLLALADLHPSWVFADVPAAVLHGLYVSNRVLGQVHLATSRKSHSRNTAQIVRHVIEDYEPVRVDGAWATSVARTTYDCLRTYDFHAAMAIADSATRFYFYSAEALLDALGKFDYMGKPSRRVLDIAAFADPGSENGGESMARAVMIEEGFMIPSLQVEIPNPVDPSDTYRVDFYWRLAGGDVVGELDGHDKYVDPNMTGGRSPLEVLADERMRESRLTGANVKVMRFSFADVLNTRKFCHLLSSFGIPDGYDIPTVARRR